MLPDSDFSDFSHTDFSHRYDESKVPLETFSQMFKSCLSLLVGVLLQSFCVIAVAQNIDPPIGLNATEQLASPSEDPQQAEFFDRKILPVLVSKCYECHSQQAAEIEGGLRLDGRAGIRQGGDSGPAVVPGSESGSLLLSALTSKDNPMPPGDPLPADVVADFRQWIVRGAFDPRESVSDPVPREPDFAEARGFWAFQSVQPQSVPAVRRDAWCRSPIDHFILSKLESRDLHPNEDCSPSQLIRRVTFDLTGLPPSPEDVESFLQDHSDRAYQSLVDKLIDSPHYGERQAQHWLDVIRYAETEGFEYDRLMPDIWRFRDYVIAAFNSDLPYDQFLIEQLAGDELGDSPSLRVAAGFHRLGAVRRNAGNQAVASSRNEVLTERTDIIGTAFLGLTVGCARCHDHKFDPIPQRDYYRLQAFVAATMEDNISLLQGPEHERRVALKVELEGRIAELKEVLSGLSGDEESRVKQEIEQLEAKLPPAGPTICSVKNDWETASPVALLKRGDPDLLGPIVGMRNLGVLADDDELELPFDTPKPRTVLARQLVDPDHPLTARVIVNRIWQQHFGTGLVSTANDFGRNGSMPSHPELLDYLANLLVANGWHLKALHREIVTSSVYRQASTASHEADAIDPTNRLLSHFTRRRLSGEELRDAMLSISGTLNREMGGRSIVLTVDPELVDQLYKPSQWEVSQDRRQHYRRSIYLLAKRNLRLPFLEVFDQPSSQTSCAVREQSTHARQALELMNGSITNELSTALAQRLDRAAGSEPSSLVRLAFRLVTARDPHEQELELSRQFLHEVGLHEFSLAMFNLNAFLYVD